MNRSIIRTLNSLCGRTEALENKMARRKDKNADAYRAYEAVADAKNRLLDALRASEGETS
jgi:hypothetical protein